MDHPRVTLAFGAGRRLLVAVVDMLVGRLRALDYARRLDLRLLVVWDRTYEREPPPLSELHGAGAGLFSAVRCLDAAASGLPSGLPEQHGYAGLRNRALAAALADGADLLLMLDDDEYFAAPWRDSGGRLRWQAVDPLGPHLRGRALGADVTNGFTLGEPSPIPRGLPDRVATHTLRRLGRALAAGSEFLEETSFLSGRLRLAPGLQPPPVRRVAVRDGLRRLTGGNLGLDLQAVRAGRLPPFFTPPFARGEDALFGARLDHARVLRVPAFVFHDPFRRHVDIPAGARPAQLSPAGLSPATVERFGRALLGWLRYAPLLLRLRLGPGPGLEAAVDELHRALDAAVPALVRGLGWEGFEVAPAALARACRRAGEDLMLMHRQERQWHAWCAAGGTAPELAQAA